LRLLAVRLRAGPGLKPRLCQVKLAADDDVVAIVLGDAAPAHNRRA
jgi:hypothetical protein